MKELDLNNQTAVSEIFDLFHLWENKNGKRREETIHELTALTRTIRDFKHLNHV